MGALIGQRIYAESRDGVIFVGELRNGALPGQFEVLSRDGIHYQCRSEDLRNVRAVSEKEERYWADRCKCSDSNDDGFLCPIHMPDSMRAIVFAPRDHGVVLGLPTVTFKSARTKLERASRACLQLNREVSLYMKSEPHGMETVENGDRYELRFRVAKPLPDDIPALASNAIHNLRSCLDSIAWAVSRRNGSKLPEHKIFFPVKKTRAAFERPESVLTIRDIGGTDWESFVRAVGPYREGNETILALHEMDIVDKHRDLLRVGGETQGIRIQASLDADARLEAGPGLINDGDPVVSVRKGYASRVELNLRLAFDGPECFVSDHVEDAMHKMHTAVCRVLKSAEEAFP